MGSTPKVSIIIPTYHDWDRLAICLNALKGQTYPSDAFEVIVVNNDPNDPTPEGYTVEANVKIVSELKSGSYAARNAGLALAEGDIIGFTDSDCIPAADWIEAAVRYFEKNPGIDRIGGRVELFIAGEKHTLAEAYEIVYSFRQEDNVAKSTSVTANMFAKKWAFEQVGLFNADMYSGGDFEWGTRAGAQNIKIGYGADVVVKHPARKELRQLLNKIKRVAAGMLSEEGEKKDGKSDLLKFLYEVRPPVNEFKHIKKRGTALSFTQKMSVFILRYRIRVLRAYEILKLKKGAKPFKDIAA